MAQYGEDFEMYEFSDQETIYSVIDTIKISSDSMIVVVKPSDKKVNFSIMSNEEISKKAVSDARKQFDGGGFRGLGIIFGIVVSPLIIPAAITPVVDRNLLADKEYLKNDIYYQAYKQEARRIKSRKVMRNFGIGATASAAYILTLFILLGI